MRFFLTLSIIFFNIASQSQPINIHSLKKIINKGICIEESEKCELDQVQYIKACDRTGDYYYGLKNYKTALRYYLLVAYLGVYTDGELQSDEPIRLRNKIAIKAGNMFLYGIGTKRNRKAAFFLYYSTPIFYTDAEKIKYSELFFKNTCRFYKNYVGDKNNDSLCRFAINPFFINDTTTALQLCNTVIKKYKHNQPSAFSRFEIKITFGSLNVNIATQACLYRVMEYLKGYLERKNTSPVSIEINFEGQGYNYHSFVLPELSVKAR